MPGFYGRTFKSELKALRPSVSEHGTFEVVDEEFVFFHTNYTEKSTRVIVELVLTKEFGMSKTVTSAGYAVCDVFDNFNTEKSIQIY